MSLKLDIFTDASYDPALLAGVGAYLVVEGGSESIISPDVSPLPIVTRLMPAEGIARLELMTVLWALAELKPPPAACLHLFTDCRAIEVLFSRRAKLEAQDYQTQKGKTHSNADLYREFFRSYDQLPFQITRVKGHSPERARSRNQQLFAQVDKTAREALRQHRRKINQ